MSKRIEYTIDEPYELTATPISLLEEIKPEEALADDIMLVVSQPNFQVQDTGYMSKKMQLSTLKDALRTGLSVDDLSAELDQAKRDIVALDDAALSLSSAIPGTAVLPQDISDPYILSSIEFDDGNIVALSGYRLADALEELFKENSFQKGNFDQLSCSSLKIDGTTLSAYGRADGRTYGVVKAFTSLEELPSEPGKIYINIDSNGRLYISTSGLEQKIVNDIQSEIQSQVSAAIAANWYETKVVTASPATMQANTLYFVVPQQ